MRGRVGRGTRALAVLAASLLLGLQACADTTTTGAVDLAASTQEPEASKRSRSRALAADRERAKALAPMIAKHAAEQGVPFELADAVVRVESRYQPGARNGPNVGLTQINVGTARSLGYSGPTDGLFDADTNLRYGIRYLAQAYRLADGDMCGTVLRYQAGHRARTMTHAARVYCGKVRTILASAS